MNNTSSRSTTHLYYVNCTTCHRRFSQRYFGRHVCSQNSDEDSFQNDLLNTGGDVQQQNEDIQSENQEATASTEIPTETNFSNIDNEQESAELSEDLFDELFMEAYADNHNAENSWADRYDDIKIVVFVKWLCLLLAHWQKRFNITDNSLEFLIKFLSIFLLNIIQDKEKEDFKEAMPKTLYSFRKFLSVKTTNYNKFAVCPKCCSLYDINECIIKRGGEVYSKTCTFVKFPNHPQQQHRRMCGEILMRKVKFSSGKELLFPIKIYCYRPVKSSLETLLAQPSFENDCQLWRSGYQLSQDSPDVLNDIYDGRIWKEFSRNGKWFFSDQHNFGLMLNVDWFQPFKHLSSYSIGAIYLVILNLPRHLRFKRKNVILVGIIPNMVKEPPTNSFLLPLVNELDLAWKNGISMYSQLSFKMEQFYVALICVGCDIPASRKLCGFLGHSAARGCSRCNKLFPGAIGERDYSGFSVNEWPKRSSENHRQQMEDILNANTAQDQSHLESTYGTRFSTLALLPYLDTIRMTIVDPMHNLFLGTAKHILKIWRDAGNLSKANLEVLQERVESFITPHDIGKIPRKIVSCFDGFNADEYKNWTLLFSIYSLHDIVPKRDLECFRKFVIACNYLTRKRITRSDVAISHGYLLQFCKSFEALYGRERVTPNMHLHMHLKECIDDFGPIYGFWLFSFKRYNGILGSLPTNKKNIDPQIMRRFTIENVISNLPKPSKYEDIFSMFLASLDETSHQRGTLHDIALDLPTHVVKISSRNIDPSQVQWYQYSDHVLSLSKGNVCAFTDFEMSTLKDVYKVVYPALDLESCIFQSSYEKFTKISLGSSIYGSISNPNSRSAYVVAYWAKDDGDIALFDEMSDLRPARIHYFFKHSVIVHDQCFEHWFAYCEWYHRLSDDLRFKFGKPVEIWSRNIYNQYGPATYIPVMRILSKFVHAPYEDRSRQLMVVVPRINHSL